MQVARYIIIFLLLFLSVDVFAVDMESVQDIFENSIGEFVTSIVNDSRTLGSPIGIVINAMMLSMSFIALFIAFQKMAYSPMAIWLPEVIEAVIWVAIMWAFWAGYDKFLHTAFQWSDGLAELVSNEVLTFMNTAPSDNATVAVFDEVFALLESVKLPLTDPIDTVFNTALFLVFCVVMLILKACMFIMVSFSFWYYAFAKIAGVLFVSFMVLKSTRAIFMNWLSIFFTAFLFHLFANLLLCLMLLYFHATLSVDAIEGGVVDVGENYIQYSAIVVQMIIGIVFCFGVGKLVSSMSSIATSACAGVGDGVTKTATTVAKFAL